LARDSKASREWLSVKLLLTCRTNPQQIAVIGLDFANHTQPSFCLDRWFNRPHLLYILSYLPVVYITSPFVGETTTLPDPYFGIQ